MTKKEVSLPFKNNAPYYFLACPYHGSQEEKEDRYILSQKVTLYFLELGIFVFAPLLYNQTLAVGFNEAQSHKRRALLMPMNLSFLHYAAGILFLKTPGWEGIRGH